MSELKPEIVTEKDSTEGYPLLQCPYCLYSNQSILPFEVLGKKGNTSKKMARCPQCHVNLRMRTLRETGKMDFIQYAEYLASLANWDVNRKVKWYSIFEALKKVDPDTRNKFWEAYRAERSRINPEYAVRKQAEQYERDNVPNGFIPS